MGFNETKAQIAKAIQEAALEAERDQKLVAYEILREVVESTPVKTGRARGNWNVGIGSPDRTCNPYYHDPQGYATIERGANKIDSAKLGQNIYISNTVYNPGDDPEDELVNNSKEATNRQAMRGEWGTYYIDWIDRGGSPKAPAGISAPLLAAIKMKLGAFGNLSDGGAVKAKKGSWKQY